MKSASITRKGGAEIARSVDVAATFMERLLGLLAYEQLQGDEGLLLTPGGSIHTFGMRFTIDALFLDSSMRILKISPQLRPGRLAIAPTGTRSVLELAAGRAQRCGLGPGVQLTLQYRESHR